MVNKIVGVKSLATRFEEALLNDQALVPVRAHAALSRGMAVQIVAGVTAAPDANDRLGFFGIVEEDIASGAEGRCRVKGIAKALSGAAITLGSICDCSADMFIDAAGTQTDGNCGFRALETASGAGVLIFVKIL
jgi:hypothetical protein